MNPKRLKIFFLLNNDSLKRHESESKISKLWLSIQDFRVQVCITTTISARKATTSKPRTGFPVLAACRSATTASANQDWPFWRRPSPREAQSLDMDQTELDTFRRFTSRRNPPNRKVKEGWLVCGRRGGKSFILAMLTGSPGGCGPTSSVFRSAGDALSNRARFPGRRRRTRAFAAWRAWYESRLRRCGMFCPALCRLHRRAPTGGTTVDHAQRTRPFDGAIRQSRNANSQERSVRHRRSSTTAATAVSRARRWTEGMTPSHKTFSSDMRCPFSKPRRQPCR
jgi:hypothetical protein